MTYTTIEMIATKGNRYSIPYRTTILYKIPVPIPAPQKAAAIREFNDLFVHLRYGKLEVSKPHLKQLKRYIHKL